MTGQELTSKCLETAIKTMERNRALLFAINLIAALLIVVTFLENVSLDVAQTRAYLIRFQQRCNEIETIVKEQVSLSAEDLKVFNGCSDIKSVESIIIAKIQGKEALSILSNKMRSLYIFQNEMRNIRLDSASVAPLGFGLAVPRNDLTLICGVLLAILYIWLAFSFRQLARIITKIKKLPKGKKNLPEDDESKFNLNDIIEMNFLFFTSKDRSTRFFVKLLYFAAPLSMSIASFNNILTLFDTSDYIVKLRTTLYIQLVIQLIFMGVLWYIALDLNKSDKKANVSSETR